jgi:5-methylthioadenosine/S-adenosylhomocysteine deaminase
MSAMQQRTFFRGPVLITLDPPLVEAADILVADGRIARKGWRLHAPADAEIIDARGRIICPGLVNAHVRLDASFARTMPFPSAAPADVEKLQAVETEESVIAAAFAVGIEAARAGCTSLFNFHDGPGFVRGSLARIRDVMSTIGLRMTAACGLTSRLSDDGLASALLESRDAATFGCGGRTAFVLGAGDLARIPDSAIETLAEAGRRYQTPIHATIGSGADAAAEIARLRAAGLLRPHSILLLLQPIGAAEAERLSKEGVTLVHSPSAEAATARPPRSLAEFATAGALGTDAGRPDLFEEARLAFSRARAAGDSVAPRDVVALLARGTSLASEIFKTRLGSFEPGSAADLVVLDYRPTVPLNPATLCHHVLFGLSSAAVQHVMVDGHMIVRDRTITNIDVRNLFRQTQRGALDLWQRMFATEFPGLRTLVRSAPTAAEAEPRENGREARRFDEDALEFEPLEQPEDALAPWLVCKPPAQSEVEGQPAAPIAPAIPAPAKIGTAAEPKRGGAGFGAGIV